MEYEVVTLEEKVLVGVSTVTGNADPNMSMLIGGLWGKLYQEGIVQQIKNKVNDHSIGLYSDYEGEQYCVTVGCEVSEAAAENKELTIKTIPAGKYAKFEIHGDVQKAVAMAWTEIWKMDLNRSFTGDFEEYLNNENGDADISIYIALK